VSICVSKDEYIDCINTVVSTLSRIIVGIEEYTVKLDLINTKVDNIENFWYTVILIMGNRCLAFILKMFHGVNIIAF